MQWSLKEIGLSWTMRLLAAMLAVLMLGSLTWIPKFQARHTELDHYLRENKLSICTRMSLWMKKFLNVRIWKNKGYLVWAIASPVAFLGYFVPFVHLVSTILCAVRSWHSMVSFLQNIHNRLTHKIHSMRYTHNSHPIAHPCGWAMGCLLWV